MTTPRDLLIITMDVSSGRSVEQGNLSLALAGAELIDLIDVQVLTLDGDGIVPAAPRTMGDRLLDEAAASLTRQAPYEPIEDWLWRRGRDLAAAYLAALEAEGQVDRPRHRWNPIRTGPAVWGDASARRRAADRWTSGEPVLMRPRGRRGHPRRAHRRGHRPRRRSGRDRTGRCPRRGDGTGSRTATAKYRKRGLRQHLARPVTKTPADNELCPSSAAGGHQTPAATPPVAWPPSSAREFPHSEPSRCVLL